jgi:biotin operon repressor
MRYQRSLAIEQRLDAVLRLIRKGQYSTPLLADELQVSIPTISRCVEALRERGHDIAAENHNGIWRYVLKRKARRARSRTTSPAEFVGSSPG